MPSIQNHPRVLCPFASEPERDERGPKRSHCVNGRIVHFLTGEEMDCHMCRGKGTIRDPASHVCNACGGSMLPEFPEWWLKRHGGADGDGGLVERRFPLGLVDAQVTGGYDSRHIFDLTTYEWSMCEGCLRTMFNGFKVPPYVADAIRGSSKSYKYEDDRKYWEFRVWKDSGNGLAWAKRGGCNGSLRCSNATTHRRYTSGSISGDESLCDEHANEGLALNVESVSFADVPELAKVRFFSIDAFDFDALTYPWTAEERAAIAEGAKVFHRKNDKRMGSMGGNED